MKFSSNLLEEAVNAFASLPGIGRKSALRLVLHYLKKEDDRARQFLEKLHKAKTQIKQCSTCYNYADEEICEICKDRSRNTKTICVVESVRDVMAIEDTNQYSGVYHVLGGVISPIDDIGPEDLKIDELIKRVGLDDAEELIMAISPSIEGETTIFYLSKLLKDTEVNISTIARGVSFGGELEYADELTLGRSIAARVPYSID